MDKIIPSGTFISSIHLGQAAPAPSPTSPATPASQPTTTMNVQQMGQSLNLSPRLVQTLVRLANGPFDDDFYFVLSQLNAANLENVRTFANFLGSSRTSGRMLVAGNIPETTREAAEH